MKVSAASVGKIPKERKKQQPHIDKKTKHTVMIGGCTNLADDSVFTVNGELNNSL